MPFPFHLLSRDTLAIAKPSRGKGVRSTGAQNATHPCRVAGASGSAVVWDLRMLRTALCRASACLAFSLSCAWDRHRQAKTRLRGLGRAASPE
jgi:hypothetical protein